jgi:hypothetical protein
MKCGEHFGSVDRLVLTKLQNLVSYVVSTSVHDIPKVWNGNKSSVCYLMGCSGFGFECACQNRGRAWRFSEVQAIRGLGVVD